MANVTDKAVLSPAVRDYYNRVVLMTAYPMLVYTRFGQKAVIPKKNGDSIVWSRYNKFDTVPVPIQDGKTPPGVLLDVSRVKATVDWYGNFVILTNQVEMTVEDKLLNQSTRLMAQNAAATIDEITRDVLVSTSSVLLCSHGDNLQTPTELTRSDINAAAFQILGNSGEMISEIMTAKNLFGTGPLRPAFFGFIHTDLLSDLENVSGFQPTSSYSEAMKALDGEWGATGNVRWLYTQVGSVSSASPAVYNLPIVGKEAYGLVHLGQDTTNFYVEPLGSAGAADPLHQRGSVGWDMPFAARILNDNFMVNLMATAA